MMAGGEVNLYMASTMEKGKVGEGLGINRILM
jgi:hypothetical protein